MVCLILYQITAASNSSTDADSIKAVALVLEETLQSSLSDHVAAAIAERIEEQIGELGQCLIRTKEDEMERFLELAREQQDEMKGIMEENRNQKDGMDEVANKLQNACLELAEMMSSLLENLQEKYNKIGDHIDDFVDLSKNHALVKPLTPSTSTLPPNLTINPPIDTFTYTAITKRHLPEAHTTVLARNNEKRRQFTIESAELGVDADKLSKEEMVTKLKEAFDKMMVGKMLAPQDIWFLGVRRMKKGGIIFNLNSDAAADWLRCEDIRRDFASQFGSTSTIQGYQFRVLVEYVPVSLDVNAPGAAARIESNNDLPPGSIKEITWVKHIEKRIADPTSRSLKDLVRIHQPR